MSQNIKVKNIKKLPVSHEAFFPTFGNNSNEVFITGKNHKGLILYNTKTKKETVISDKLGSGVNPVVNSTGDVVFKTTSIQKGKKHVEYKSYSFTTQLTQKYSVEKGKIQVKTNGKKIEVINTDNKVNSISPLGDVYYIWASLSPNKSKILFTAVGKGTFIADLNGNIIQYLGYLNAPSWIDSNWVLGMNDIDDGHVITQSTIEAIHVNSKKRVQITDANDFIALNPKSSIEGNRIVFHTQAGEVYVVKIRIKE